MLGALTWSGAACAVTSESAVNVSNAGAPIAGATISIKPVARSTPRPVSTAQRPVRVAPPKVTTRSDGTYRLHYDDELHRGMLFDVTVTAASGHRYTLRGLSIEQILAGIDVAAPGSATPAIALPSTGPGSPTPGMPGGTPSVEVNLSGGGTFVGLPDRGFIARELQGSGVQEFNQVTPSSRSTGAGAQFKISINDAPTPASRIFFTFNYFNVDTDSTGAYDPGGGFRLNLAGAQGGASGVSIGGNPLNRVTNILFSNNTEGFSGGGGIRLPLGGTLASGTSFDAGIGVTGNRLTSREAFNGQIPGFNRDFSYTSNVSVNSVQLDLGIGATQIFRPTGSGVIMLFQGDVTVSPGVFSGNGTDRFSFTGINTSTADLSKSEIDVGVGVSAGLNFGLPGSTVSRNRINGPSIFVKGGYESRPGFPVIERDGTNPSRLELKRADIFTVSGGVTVPFNMNTR
ncbi:hypothetical protein LJR220_005689 [Bradyrhizobium sp. LjRoot220]|uniref:hypothetical protein n=1 Tax=Bradyrhizobium sp. LjRoot220 TaxID=3342284 RepID=UPI003ED0A53F